MREIQTGLHKPEGATKQRLTKSADNSAPVCFPNCASICLGSRVSFDLPLALIPITRPYSPFSLRSNRENVSSRRQSIDEASMQPCMILWHHAFRGCVDLGSGLELRDRFGPAVRDVQHAVQVRQLEDLEKGGPHPEKDDLALLAVDSTLDRTGNGDAASY